MKGREETKMELSFRIFIFLFITIFTFSFISALNCDKTSITKNVIVGLIPSSETISCTNPNDYNVTVYKSGDFFSTLPPTNFIIPNSSSQSFSVNFIQMNSAGLFTAFIYSSDGNTIPVNVNVTTQIIQGGIIVFPTSKIVNIKQGQTKQINLQIIVPSNYPTSITIQSVSFNPEISDLITFGDLDLGNLNPGQTLNIPIILDANDVQTGTYSTSINILATDSQGQISLPSVNLQVIVTIGVSSSTGANFTQPSCSLSALEFNTNNTYTFICDNVVTNLQVNVPYNEYLQGINGDYSGGKFTYTFKAKKTGSSTFIATFTYMGSTLFDAYIQDFKVTPSGTSSVGGTTMNAQFFQFGQEKVVSSLTNGEVVIMALDNKTGNIIPSFKIILNGEEKNSTKINLELGYIYSLRLISQGYDDLIIQNISVSENQLTISLDPFKDIYMVGDIVNITISIEDASLLLDNVIITSPYTFFSVGSHLLEAKKEGYLSVSINITVEEGLSYSSLNPSDITKWKKGTKVNLILTKDIAWVVQYYESYEDKETGGILYKEPVNINSGTTNPVGFELESYGDYKLIAGDKEVFYYSLVKKNLAIFEFFKNNWLWILLGIGGLIFIIFIAGRSGGKGSKSRTSIGGGIPKNLSEQMRGEVNY